MADNPDQARCLGLMRPSEIEWQETRFHGCKIKTLAVDEKRGQATTLMHIDRATAVSHDERIFMRQAYLLEGRLLYKEDLNDFVEVGKGEFVWQHEDVRRMAWCPDGAVILGIFQMRRSIIRKGRMIIPELNREIWNEMWTP